MQIVIDIPEEDYMGICHLKTEQLQLLPEEVAETLMHIKNGILLPKGHGRLIDATYLKDVILLHNWHGNDKNIVPYSERRGYRLRDNEVLTALINAPTIIEADKESEKV